MSLIDYADRYNAFQADAVLAVEGDFRASPNGRFLLVIPTGGGKTFTAVKAVNRLFESKILDPTTDMVLWTAHRIELLSQANDTFSEFEKSHPSISFRSRVLVAMIGSVKSHLANNNSIKLVVIDEAHHGAAGSYRPIFERENIGVLGLTATPTRHDGLPLEFERESYSIGFPDLVKRGVILTPQVTRIIGGSYNLKNLDETSLEILNNTARNQRIIEEISTHQNLYKKVIIYVGTKNHVQSLHRDLCCSTLPSVYDSISYITGDSNSRNEDREVFVKKEKAWGRAILVNVHVLSEGYDDPSVNTVVMATPTQSKLYYMQAIGRCIRRDPGDSLKKAYIVEVADELPNIRYRIDNRWLFADVSDALEPSVVDHEYGSENDLKRLLRRIWDEYKVPPSQQKEPAFNPDSRYSMLLFRKYLKSSAYACLPIFMSDQNRRQVANMFNFLSERMAEFKKRQVHADAAFRMVGSDAFTTLPEGDDRNWVYGAMENAVPDLDLETSSDFIREGRPWITFISLRYRKEEGELSPELLAFVSDMVNREDILQQVCSRTYEPGSSLIRLPLPLGGFIGRIVTADELSELDQIIQQLSQLKSVCLGKDHRSEVRTILGSSVLPIELAHSDSLVLVVRDNLAYSLRLK